MENEFSAVLKLVRADFNIINNFFTQYSAAGNVKGTGLLTTSPKANNQKLIYIRNYN